MFGGFMDILYVILEVLIILGIIAAGSFIIVLIADLILSSFDGHRGIFFNRDRKIEKVNVSSQEKDKNKEEVKEEKEEKKKESGVSVTPYYEELAKNKEEVAISSEEESGPAVTGVDFDKAAEEQKMIKRREQAEFVAPPAPAPAPAPTKVEKHTETVFEEDTETELSEAIKEVSKQALREISLDGENRRRAEEESRIVEERRLLAEERKLAEEEKRRRAEEDVRRAADEERKILEAERRAAEEERNRQKEEDRRRLEEERRRDEEERLRIKEEDRRRSEEDRKKIEEELREAEEERRLAKEERRLLAEERRRAEEERQETLLMEKEELRRQLAEERNKTRVKTVVVKDGGNKELKRLRDDIFSLRRSAFKDMQGVNKSTTTQTQTQETEIEVKLRELEELKEHKKSLDKERNELLKYKNEALNRESELERIAEEKEALAAEKAELQRQIVELKNKTFEPPVDSKPYYSKDYYLKRLDSLQSELKEVEKELKANRREFVPLERIKKSYDRDQEKLRRKEAIVAKQKVSIYGIKASNVDPKRKEKLDEDVKQLNQLKESVFQCDQVLKQNKDRYPVLEKANRLLTKTYNRLVAEIESVKAALAWYEEHDKK